MLLLPYLRAAFSRYAEDATPPFRALVLEDPNNLALVVCDDQSMVGDRMMVAPLFDGEASRMVTIPRGDWCDFWTGEAVAGGQKISLPASYERIPVYVKAGSVLPVGAVGSSTADPKTRHLTVRIFGDGSLPFTLGAEGRPELRLAWHNGKGTIEQQGVARPYEVTAWAPATNSQAWLAPL
jgi:alpha-D-xyloside xylohydrolase